LIECLIESKTHPFLLALKHLMSLQARIRASVQAELDLHLQAEIRYWCSVTEGNLSCQAYHKKILVCHPDKGGDPAIFREVQKVFEVLKEIAESHDKHTTRFVSFAASGKCTASAKNDTWSHFEGSVTPTWEFYHGAAEENMPIYHMVSTQKRCTALPSSSKF